VCAKVVGVTLSEGCLMKCQTGVDVPHDMHIVDTAAASAGDCL